MGNCLRNNQISAQEEKNCESPVETSVAKVKAAEQAKTPSSSSSELEPAQREENMEKMVRFIQKDERGDRESYSDGRSGAVRIRVVVTQKELKRILGCNNESQQTSLQQLLSAMKLRGRTISGVGECDWGGTNPWRPALESIPEDRSMK